MLRPYAGLQAMFDGAAYEFLAKTAEWRGIEYWRVRPLFVEAADTDISVPPSARITPLHSKGK